MIIDYNYCLKVLKRILIIGLTILGMYLSFKLAIFYIPFLIAFILSCLLEPIIRFLMKKFKLKRKVASILVFIISLSIIIGLIIWGVVTLINESTNLLAGLNSYIDKILTFIKGIISNIDGLKINLSEEFVDFITNSASQSLNKIAKVLESFLTNILNFITTIPTIVIYVVITFLSLYFICTDKIYMLDIFEHHFPEIWAKKIVKHIRQIIKLLGSFLKAQCILVLISFTICLIGLYIFKIIGFNIEYPLLIALGIAFVDALPIFGSGAVMVPWAVFTAFNGDVKLAIFILGLLVIMSILRQIVEPKIVSGKIGVHPIFTLIAMYTGFRIIGVFGMLLGPIILIIVKNIFSGLIDKGAIKTIFER